jgi:ABC-type uncharacterized transport system substrate-binding protein
VIFHSLKKLALGFSLIALAAAVLLLSDLDQRHPAKSAVLKVALVQHTSHSAVAEGVDGILKAMADEGFKEGEQIAVTRFDAQGDIAAANAIARQICSGSYDLLLTATTISLQTVASANKDGRTRHVFGIVSDPYSAGVGISRTNHLDHPRHMTGLGTMAPVRAGFQIARQLLPTLKTVGVAWNPAESNSEANVKLARQVTAEMGLTLLEANVENSSGVSEAIRSLIGRGIQMIWVSSDITVITAIDSLVAAARQAHIPAFTNIPGCVNQGTLFDLGANFFATGVEVGKLAAKVLGGMDPATIPVENIAPELLHVNLAAIKDLKEHWAFPPELLAQADLTIDASGHSKKKGVASPAPSAGSASVKPTKTWRVNLLELNNVLDVEESERGILEGLRASLRDGQDFTVKIRNAQGDMATLPMLVDTALAEGADIFLTMSSPTLQAAIQRGKGTPTVFTYVSSAAATGACKTFTDHLPHVTGIQTLAPYEEAIGVMKQCVPHLRTIGTLYCPAEVNMVYSRDKLLDVCKKAGLELVSVAANSTTDVPDAALALISHKVDAICQLTGNLTAVSFSGIAAAAQKAKVPVFAFQKVQAIGGAQICLCRDFYGAGRAAAELAVRIMRGESPARIPIVQYAETRVIVNPKAAAAIGFTIPPDLMKKADEVIGK